MPEINSSVPDLLTFCILETCPSEDIALDRRTFQLVSFESMLPSLLASKI